MAPLKTEYRSWDDLVFENRNKDYGAYVIRKGYNDALITATLSSMAIVAILFFLANIRGKADQIPALPDLKERIITIVHPPTIQPRQVAPVVREVRQTRRADLPPRVVSHPVEPTPVVENPPEPVTMTGTETGTTTTVTGSLGVDTRTEAVPVPVDVNKTHTHVEVMPEYEGGMQALMKFIKKHMRYPSSAERMGVEGTVFVGFVVTGSGSVTEVEVVRGFHPDCDREAARVIGRLSKWKGGRQGGIPVRVRMVLPIKFQLSK